MSDSPILSVHLGAELKQKWLRFCSQQGEKPSTALRQIVIRLLNRGYTSQAESEYQSEETDAKKSYRIEIRLREKELKALQELALQYGFNRNRYIASLVVNHLSSTPQFGQFELDQITVSNSQLLKIGRNLNQITRQLNASLESSDQLKVEFIESLHREIKVHVQMVAGLIEANLEHWKRGQP